ncbi:hypothetical protein ALC62_09279, partial [Cyphomyrmex costatus]
AVSRSVPPVAGDFAARLERMENERRDLELIVFGLPRAESVDAASLMRDVAASLGVALAPGEIAASFRIPAKDASGGEPLVARFTTIARRNELLARARRRRADFVASHIRPL